MKELTVFMLEAEIAKARTADEPCAMILWIGPEIAEYIINKHKGTNRDVNLNYVRTYARYMKSSTWFMATDAIGFSKNGFLANGEHRALACMLSGVGFPAIVAFGLDDNVFGAIDSGNARGLSQFLKSQGVKNSTVIAGILRPLHAYEREEDIYAFQRVINHEYWGLLKQHPGIMESAIAVQKWTKQLRTIGPIPGGFIHYVGGTIWNRKLSTETYLKKICTGEDVTTKSPEGLIRNRYIKVGMEGKLRITSRTSLSLLIYGWRAVVQKAGRVDRETLDLIIANKNLIQMPVYSISPWAVQNG